MISIIETFEDLFAFMKKEKRWHTVLAFVYLRVSTQEQADEGYSLEAQRKFLVSYAEKLGLKYAFILEETESARKAGRSQFKKMVDFYGKRTKAGSCPVMIVEKVDRLTRNIQDAATVYDLIHSKSLEVHFAKERQILSDKSRSSDILVLDIKLATARFFANLLSEEAKKGMAEKAAQGMFPSFAPIGYLNKDDANGRKIITPDPDRAPVIKKIFEWYASGNHSLSGIVTLAKEHGLTSTATGRHLPKSSILEILNRLIYTGSFLWNGEEYRGTYEAIITRELFDKVQEMLHGKVVPKARQQIHPFAFKGLLVCGKCGCAIVGEIKKGKYIYYHCTGMRGPCPNKRKNIREEVIESEVLRSLQSLRLDDEVLDWMISSLRTTQADDLRTHQEAISRLETQVAQLEQRRKNLTRLMVDGKVEPEEFDAYRAEILEEQSEIERKIQAHRDASPEHLENGAKLLELVQASVILYKTQSMEEKRRLLQIVYSNSILDEGKPLLSYRKPFDFLAVTNSEYQKKKTAFGDESGLRTSWLPGPDSNQRQGG